MREQQSNHLLKEFYLKSQQEYINFRSKESDDNNDGKFFAEWYFSIIEGYDKNLLTKIITDGKNDKGIDALMFDNREGLIQFYQFKSSQKRGFGGTDWSVFKEGIELFMDVFFGEKKLDEIKSRISDRLFFAFETVISQANEASKNDTFSGFQINIITNHDSFNSAIKREIEEYIELKRKKGFRISKSIKTSNDLFEDFLKAIHKVELGEITLITEYAPEHIKLPPNIEENKGKLFVGVISGKELAKLYEKYGEKLLQKNVRIYKSNSPVNEEIYKTAIMEGEDNPFLFYNNGITIVTEEYRVDRHPVLKNPQIVNGGQTIRTIHRAFTTRELNNDLLVQVRIMVIGDEPDFASQISAKLNTQTNIEGQEIISFLEVILILDLILRIKGYYLERRTNEFETLPEAKKEELAEQFGVDIDDLSDRVIKFKELLQYLAILDEEKIVSVKREYSQFMEEEILNNLLLNIREMEPQALIDLSIFSKTISSFIDENRRLKRSPSSVTWEKEYNLLVKTYPNIEVRDIIANSNLIVQTVLYLFFTHCRKMTIGELRDMVENENGHMVFMKGIELIIGFASQHNDKIDAKWRTLLIRQTFVKELLEWVKGCPDFEGVIGLN